MRLGPLIALGLFGALGVADPSRAAVVAVAAERPAWATLSDEGAATAVREALTAHRLRSGLPALAERAELAKGLARSVKAAAAADSIRDRPVPFRRTAQFFFFTASDPARLPVLVTSMSEGARESAVAATFRRTPSHPDGIYWVALALE